MNRTSKLSALLIVSMMLIGASQTHMQASFASHETLIIPTENFVFAGYDSPNITVVHNSPANGSTQTLDFNINVDITSDFGPLNLTLYIDDAVDSNNNLTTIGTGNQDIAVDVDVLSEGMLNFTLFFEYLAEKETVYLLYFIDNDGVDFEFALYTPANGSEQSGIISIDVNATHDFGELNLTVLVDGVAQTPYNPALIPSGDLSIIVDTSVLWEGYDNFTLLFEYDILATHFSSIVYLEYLIDNDGEPITIGHQSPAYGAEVSGSFDLVLSIGSEYEPLNLTLYVDSIIQSDFNETPIGRRTQTISINATSLQEGLLNFTLVFEYNVTGENLRIEYYLEFTVNNHGVPGLVILSPSESDTITGLADLWLNITSTLGDVYLNITVDGELVPEYNATMVAVGDGNYTLNSSSYENGNHLVAVTVYTPEGENKTVERNLIFLDYVRVFLTELSSFNEVSGDQEFNLRIETPFDNATLSLYVDGELVDSVSNITLVSGSNQVIVDTTVFEEGEAEFTFKAYDGSGHVWIYSVILIIDNHGPPVLRFSTTADVVLGSTSFTIDVDTDLTTVFVSVYIDDELLENYVNRSTDVSGGTFSFTIDVSAYSKAEHVVKIVIFTAEGEKSEVERVFGFASFRIEEIVSGIILLGVALLIPLYRWRKGQSIRSVIIVDVLFFVVIAAAFIGLGVNTIPFITWHFNLASIWAFGSALIFTNWVLPIVMQEEE